VPVSSGRIQQYLVELHIIHRKDIVVPVSSGRIQQYLVELYIIHR
jgi:hypothetical protein